MKHLYLIPMGVLYLFYLVLPVAAQNAALVGTARDAQQSVMPNVAITLTNIQTGVSQATKTDTEGNYEFQVASPGDYSLKALQAGFKTFVQSLFALRVDERSRIDAVIEVGTTTTAVTVEAAASGVQTESSSLGDVVDNRKIVEIPLNGRFLLDLALLTAGTTVPITSYRTFLAVPSGIGMSGINASGTREDSTNYTLDGINST